MPVLRRLTLQELNPIFIFSEGLFQPLILLNINTDRTNLSSIQIKFNYTVYTNRLCSCSAVGIFFRWNDPFIFKSMCVSVVQDRVVYQVLNTLCAGDGRLGNATVSNSFEQSSDSQANETTVTSVFPHLFFICHDHLVSSF